MCFQINELKYLKLTILRFLPRPPLTYTTLIAVKTFFIVKTFIIHEFTWIYFNSHNFYIYILKCIFWGSNYFRVCGCWLVWLLLYVFIVADWLVWLLIYLTVLFYQELKTILACIDTNLRCIKDCVLLRIKQTDEMSRVCVLRISMKPCKLQGRTASFQGGLDKNSLCQKCREGA